jgi:hypothetical protein
VPQLLQPLRAALVEDRGAHLWRRAWADPLLAIRLTHLELHG